MVLEYGRLCPVAAGDKGRDLVEIITTGGTFDKVYFDRASHYAVGESMAPSILARARVTVEHSVVSLMRKDSLDMNDGDRALIVERVRRSMARKVVVIHGSDTIVETGKCLQVVAGKTIALTGAFEPARTRESDADFNLGMALAIVQCASPGVYIAFNGVVFPLPHVCKNRTRGCFQVTELNPS